jgi:alcohol dehydrogenase (NADP+)
MMQKLALANGDQLPALGLGTWKAEPGQVGQAVQAAIRLGYRHIDCAKIYGNEAEIGAALAEMFARGEVRRDELWITSKLWNDAHQPSHVLPTLQQTLSHLQLEYLDLYLVDTWRAMQDVHRQGLTRHIGVANFTRRKLQLLMDQGGQAPEVNQLELHPYLQQWPMLEFCQQHHILLTGYAPLGSAGRPEHLKPADEPILLQDPTILSIAARHGVTPAQVLIQWGIARGVSVIPKSVRPERLAENFAAARVQLTGDDLQQIKGLERHRRYFTGQFWTFPEHNYTPETLWDGEN